MPNYEYKCTKDGSTFELWQEVGAPAPPCPDCGAPTKKVFHPTRTIFKGAGFYVTDLRAESQNTKVGAKAEAKSNASSETNTEASAPAAPSASETTASETAKVPAPAKESGPAPRLK